MGHEPVSRILGAREFWGLTLEISPATLDPRPDTETLVEAALRLRREGQAVRVLDLGTGSGSILLALLSAWPEATGVGVDIVPEAVAVAARNAERHGLADRARFQIGDWGIGLDGPFDVVVSNPPYITDAEMAVLAPEVANFDPARALRGGADGLAAYRAIASQLKSLIAADGVVLFEVGQGQAESVAAILTDHGFCQAAYAHDLAGVARVVSAAASSTQSALEL
jgi:release factor glutamine methyltransferase